MQIHDIARPTIAHRPAFTGGMVVIPRPQIWPLEGGQEVEISMMLPIKELDGFIAKWFTATLPIDELPNWLRTFNNNPEETITETFNQENGFTPNLEAKTTTRIMDPYLLDDL
jgi:hypothetical protein